MGEDVYDPSKGTRSLYVDLYIPKEGSDGGDERVVLLNIHVCLPDGTDDPRGSIPIHHVHRPWFERRSRTSWDSGTWTGPRGREDSSGMGTLDPLVENGSGTIVEPSSSHLFRLFFY